jgi:hypothetical protein
MAAGEAESITRQSALIADLSVARGWREQIPHHPFTKPPRHSGLKAGFHPLISGACGGVSRTICFRIRVRIGRGRLPLRAA